jgi:MoaA/NifB/PqqE/SkfB family radical SAM enzyme
MLLREMVGEIVKAVDLTWVSLDCDSDFHSKMRGVEGIFEKALEGIQALKLAHGKVAINCVLSNLNPDVVPRMAELAKRCGAKLAFDPMHIFSETNEQHALSPSQRKQAFSEAAELKEKGYPILNSFEYLQNQTNLSYSCAQPRIFVDVSEDGKVNPFWCAKSNGALGDLRLQSLGEIIYSNQFQDFVKVSNGCSLCSHSTTFETSIFYSARRFFTNLYRLNSPYLKFIKDFALT